MRVPLIIFYAVLGAVAAHAHEITYNTSLSGANESPSNNSPGIGSAVVTIDFDLFTMRVVVSFSGLTGMVTAAHIHAATDKPLEGTAGIATQTPSFEMFPTGLTSGSYDHTFNLTLDSSYNPDFIAANGGTISTASNAFFAALAQSKAYLDIHTTTFADGEIRGFLIPPKIAIGHISATLSGGQRLITVVGTATPFGLPIWLERSSDFLTWDIIDSANSDAGNGSFTFNAVETLTTTAGFYRIELQQAD